MHIRSARSFPQRALGLLGLSALPADEGLLIRPCASIHTFGMRFAIDVLFVDRNGIVLAAHADVGPWRMLRCRGATAVLELAAGGARALCLRSGQHHPGLLNDPPRLGS
ncbi:MAG: DUF192 domain-containing protein [Thauera sp.]|jgi:uncharacterized membrane protein (UPF0127 family)